MITYISVRGIPLLIKSPKTCKVFFRSIIPDKKWYGNLNIIFIKFIITAIKQYVHNIIKKILFYKTGWHLATAWGPSLTELRFVHITFNIR